MMISKNTDLRNKILITLGYLFLIYLGGKIAIPWVYLKTETLTINTSLIYQSEYNLFMLGVSPYLFSGIVINVLTSGISSLFNRWKREGEAGINKIRTFQYIVTAILAYSLGLYQLKLGIENSIIYLAIEPEKVALILMGGSLLYAWVADRITQRGIANGVSICILYSILFTMFSNLNINLESLTIDGLLFDSRYLTILILLGIVTLFVAGLAYFSSIKIIIPVEDAGLEDLTQFNQISFPLNSAGFTPVFFSNIILNYLLSFYYSIGVSNLALAYNISFYAFFISLMFICSYKSVSPKKKAEEMRRKGLYIQGVRPGKETSDYLTKEVIVSTGKAVVILAIVHIGLSLLNTHTIISALSLGTTTILLLGIITNKIYEEVKEKILRENRIGYLFNPQILEKN